MLHCSVNSAASLPTVLVNFNLLALFTYTMFFFKNQLTVFFSEKPVQLIDFTRIVHVNMIVIFFLKKFELNLFVL